MLQSFDLPSRPDISVAIRDASVVEAMAWSKVNPALDEEVTTIFLKTVCTSSIPVELWTAQDRLLALFWFHLQTSPFDTKKELAFSNCPACGGTHKVPYDMRELANNYQPLSRGLTETVRIAGRQLSIHPLFSDGIEHLEYMRFSLPDPDNDPTGFRQGTIDIAIAGMALQFDFAADAMSKKTNGQALSDRIDWIRELEMVHYYELRDKIHSVVSAMPHGLPSSLINGQVQLRGPVFHCPKKEGAAGIQLHMPFRGAALIPTL